ncbi:Clp1 [Aphelenchoides avenae]|nr:Clp1 [Aphelenchus avenae]
MPGAVVALLFPILNTRLLAGETLIYFLQHWLIVLVPLYLMALGGPFVPESSGNISWPALSLSVILIYHFIPLQFMAYATHVIYLNTHAALEQCRRVAEEALDRGSSSARGPRIMLAGPTDVGKSTVCRILCNYAIRQKRTPVYVDLDIGQGSITIPGTVGAVHVEKPVDPVELFMDHNPIVCNFGHVTPSANSRLYDELVMNLARLVNEKCDSCRSARLGGVIINTCGWVKGDGYEYLVKAAEAFEPDIVVVLDHERLFIDLERDLPAFVKVLLQPKSGGVETRARDYFYGTIRKTLHPFTFEIPYDRPVHELELFVYKVGQEELPESCLPVGVSVGDPSLQVLQLPFDENLVNHALALVPNESKLDTSLSMQSVLGFVLVTALDSDTKTLTVLSPQTHPLPSRIAIFSDVTYYDQ